MTTSEAIKTMEYNRHLLGPPDQGSTWRANGNTIACDIAITALKEKQEREKGCEVCSSAQKANGFNCTCEERLRKVLGFHFCHECGRKLGENNG